MSKLSQKAFMMVKIQITKYSYDIKFIIPEILQTWKIYSLRSGGLHCINYSLHWFFQVAIEWTIVALTIDLSDL